MASNNYASFGIRWVAHIIDLIVLYVLNWIVFAPILAALGFAIASNEFDELIEAMTEGDIVLLATLISAWIVASFALLAIRIIYGALMESSKYQATVGKLAMGIHVTDTNGSRLTFLKAFLRHIGKILSGWILFIGYLMAAFTDKKQALHDYLAGSIVVKK